MAALRVTPAYAGGEGRRDRVPRLGRPLGPDQARAPGRRARGEPPAGRRALPRAAVRELDLTEEERAQVQCPEHSQPGAGTSALLVRKASFDRTGGFSFRFPVGEFIDWYARATELGLGFAMLPEVLLKRRIHRTNTGRERRETPGYTRIVKEALDRRRSGSAL